MSDLADVVRSLTEELGSDVNVFKKGNETTTPDSTVRALKNRKKGSQIVVFQFPNSFDLVVGDVLVMVGARDRWVVTEAEDVIIQNRFSHLEAFVEKDVVKPRAKTAERIMVPDKLVDITTHRFDVALSFPGEVRPVVEQVALELACLNGDNSCFYDNNYRAQLARPELDLLLQDIYRNRAKLVVVFLGGDYQRKNWCGVEFRAIREILMARDHKRIMFVRMDDAPVDGVFTTDGYIDASKVTPAEIAHFIKERIALLVMEESMTIHEKLAAQSPEIYTGEVSSPGGSRSVVAAADDLELPPLLERYGEWAICANGIHCLYTSYFIAKNRLHEDDWVQHVTSKMWVKSFDFITAFRRAKEIFDV